MRGSCFGTGGDFRGRGAGSCFGIGSRFANADSLSTTAQPDSSVHTKRHPSAARMRPAIPSQPALIPVFTVAVGVFIADETPDFGSCNAFAGVRRWLSNTTEASTSGTETTLPADEGQDQLSGSDLEPPPMIYSTSPEVT
jgi:hypothetical protein